MTTHTHPIKSSMSRDARADLSEVVDSIRSIIRTVRISGREAEQRYGISGAQLFILQALGESEELSINELADLTFTHQSSVSMVVARLLDAKLVTRKVAQSDGRRVAVALTPAGRAMLRRSPDAGQARLIKALGAMPRSDLASLARHLSELTAMVENQNLDTTPRRSAMG